MTCWCGNAIIDSIVSPLAKSASEILYHKSRDGEHKSFAPLHTDRKKEPHMPLADCNGSSVEYRVNGTGPGLVLVHGTGQTGESSWGMFAPHFYKERRVVRPNYAGSGGTTDSGGPLTLELLADQVVAAADHAGVEHFDLVGHSLGTCVAMQIALSRPERVGKLILLAGFANALDTRMQMQFALWKRVAALDLSALATLSMLSALSPASCAAMEEKELKGIIDLMVKNTNWEGCLRQMDLDMTINLTDRLPEIWHETLVVGCIHDFVVPAEQHAKLLAQKIPNAIYKELDAGHAASHERPEEFLAMAKEFLQ